jgi:acyl-CoA synthetase (AMP-forming)/AMP-acid ligase II
MAATLRGGMQDWPLVTSSILRHAAIHHAKQKVVSATPQGLHSYSIAAMYARCVRLALALDRLGCKPGDVLATCAWNSYRHTECWCARQGARPGLLGGVLTARRRAAGTR